VGNNKGLRAEKTLVNLSTPRPEGRGLLDACSKKGSCKALRSPSPFWVRNFPFRPAPPTSDRRDFFAAGRFTYATDLEQ